MLMTTLILSITNEETGFWGSDTLPKVTKAAGSRAESPTSSSDYSTEALTLNNAGWTNGWGPSRDPQGSVADPAMLFQGFIIRDLQKDSKGKATRFNTDKARRDG